LPKSLDSKEKIWLKNYYEVHFDLPVIDSVYTISRISTVDYIIETLRGNIRNGRSIDWGFSVTAERMLNAINSLPLKEDRINEKLH
jgi:hypothetical protein